MNKLDLLVSKIVFKKNENKNFSTSEADSEFLKKYLKKNHVKIEAHSHATYFFCTMSKGNREVCADSRANLRPRNMKEALCVAAIKLFSEDSPNWAEELADALDIDITKLKY